jgi:hypothetical protein
VCQYIRGYGTIPHCWLYVPATQGNQQLLRAYIHGYGTATVGMLLCMPHCSLLILILIFILSSKREKWNCHLAFYNLCDQLLPSIYLWLRNHCLTINNSSLLVSADMSRTRCLATARLQHTYFLRYFGPLGRMPHLFLLILLLILIQSGKRGKWNYTIHRKIVMPEHTHTHIHIYIDRL